MAVRDRREHAPSPLQRTGAAPEEAALAEVADERLAAEAPTVREIRAALFELPERQRAVVVLREIGGLSYAEIGDELDLSVAAVQMLLFRARRALRSRLAPSAPVVALPGWLTGWAAGSAAAESPAPPFVPPGRQGRWRSAS